MTRFTLGVIALCTFVSGAAAADTLRHVRLEAQQARALAAQLTAEGYDVLEASLTDDAFELIVSITDLDRLTDRGYQPILLAVGRPLRDILAEQDSLPPGYADLDGLYGQMNAIAAAHPDLCTVVDLTALYGTPPTYEGRHLYAVKVSDNVADDEDEPAVLIISNFHAREISTPVIALYDLERLVTQYGSDPVITSLVADHEIWIAPTWNPDGYNHVYNVDNLWRKNRRVFSTGIGVDLNRNFPIGWEGTCAGDSDPASETFKGPSAASEAENQTLMAWSQDRHFARIIDYHSYGREVLRGYLCLTHPFSSYLTSEAAALSTASGYAGATREPSADGEHYEWQMAYMGAAANLIETHTTFQPSFASAQAEAALLWPGAVWAMQRPVPLWGYVTDELTGAPVPATLSYVGVSFANGETNPVGRFGRYHAWIPAGTYTLALTAPGYEPLTVTGVAVTGASTQLDLQMVPAPPVEFPAGGEQLPINVPTTIRWGNAKPEYQYHVQATYNAGAVGAVTESFERAQLGPNYVTGGAAPWLISTQFALVGTRSARAGTITHNQTAWMTRTAAAGSLSFWYYVSSEANGDYFNFYIDGTRVVHASGAGGWQQYTTTLGAGQHELKWEYAKNASLSGGLDSVWVDYIQMTADSTAWIDVVALTPAGADSAAWTPNTLSTSCKVRVRSYHPDATYGPWSESAAAFTVAQIVILPGDLDCSGDVGFGDINPFVLRLSNPAAYAATYPNCPDANGDIDGSGAVDFGDINPFVTLLSN